MKAKNTFGLPAILFLLLFSTRAGAQLTFTVTDLGTLGGAASQANGVAGHGANAAGMIVGSSTVSDNSEHAFLYSNGQMFDLNTLCDLSQSGFKVLTVATSISDSCLIIGGGITTNGDKHAFLLTPVSVAGGNWSYNCCQWVWIQQGGGWWWETGCGCYKWHGPPGRHPPCPPQPPPVLAVAAAVLSGLSPAGRPTATATATTATTTTTNGRATTSTAADLTWLLVLYQWRGRPNHRRGLPGEGWPMLPFQRRSAQEL